MKICTIIARNYLAFARVLAESFIEANPSGSVTVLILDPLRARNGWSDGPFDVLDPRDLALDQNEFQTMASMYDAAELATAVKPWLLRRLLADGHRVVTFLDPDIQVFASLEPVKTHAEEHGIVLTPHTLRPMLRDGKQPTETQILLAGAYNLGFISVSPAATPFLDWWAERLRRDSISAVEDGLFVDQRWLDLAVHYFDNFVIREEGYNVAYWNVDQRGLQWTGSRYEVNGEPLRFYHFSGFRPDQPERLTKYHPVAARMLPDSTPMLQRLCKEYAQRLLAAGYDECLKTPYRYDHAADGTALTPSIRRLYRERVIAADSGGNPPPSPFDPMRSAVFRDWLRAAQRAALRRRAAEIGEDGLELVFDGLRAVWRRISGGMA